jgi:serine/threonine protein kinase/tetratricopeptide (TPR) repeat protein
MKTPSKDAVSTENVSYIQTYPRPEIRVKKNANFYGSGAFRTRSPRLQNAFRMSATSSAAQSESFEDLLFLCLEQHAEGGSAAVEKVLARHPQAAGRIREELARLARLGLLGAESESSVPQTLGGFRLIRRLGEGGMGLVWEAEDPTLHRRLALKMIRPDQLHFSGSRERFRREVEAVARLQHPGIVPIYSVGEDQGIPYFTMELLDGCTLSDVLRELSGRDPRQLHGRDLARAVESRMEQQGRTVRAEGPLFESEWADVCVMIARQAAEALEHAHGRGLIHRDLKPSNLALTRTGRVMLFDFGLARAAAADGMTQSGVQPGSLPYMSPEQVQGDADIDARSDIYSLGATLHELLALQPAFPPESWEQMRERILNGGAAPLRKLNPDLSWDVETVCVVAMEGDRSRRYATAQDMARDLSALLSRRAIEARRPGLGLRLLRSTQRHPAQAVGATLGVLLLIAGPVGWELSRARSLNEITAAYEKSEQDFRLALSAIGHVLRDTATEDLRDVPRMQQARLVALDRALALYERISASRGDDLEVLAEGARLRTSRASILEDLGRRSEELEERKRALELWERVHAAQPTAENASWRIAAKAAVGKTWSGMHDPQQALQILRSAATECREWAAKGEVLGCTVAVLLSEAEANVLAGDAQAARIALDEACASVERRRAAQPDDPDLAWTMGRIEGWRASLCPKGEGQQAALQHAQRSLAEFETAERLVPAVRYYSFDVADALSELADYQFESGEHDAAEASLDAALARIDGLLRDFPDSGRYRQARSDVLNKSGVHAGRLGRFELAARKQVALLEIAESNLKSDPQRCDLALRAASAHVNLAATRIELKDDSAELIVHYERALKLLEICPHELTDDNTTGSVGSLARYGLSRARLLTGEFGSAQAAIEDHARTIGTSAERMRYSADLWNEYALALEQQRPDELAARALAIERMFQRLGEAIAAGYADRGELESTKSLDAFRDDPRFVELLGRIQSN